MEGLILVGENLVEGLKNADLLDKRGVLDGVDDHECWFDVILCSK